LELIAHGVDCVLEGLWYYIGNVKDGSPYYDFQNLGTHFLYFDEKCAIGFAPRWAVDNNKPDINRDFNLDLYSADGQQCYLYGYYVSLNNNIGAILGTHKWIGYTSPDFEEFDVTISEYEPIQGKVSLFISCFISKRDNSIFQNVRIHQLVHPKSAK
jgi:hypothetical protein